MLRRRSRKSCKVGDFGKVAVGYFTSDYAILVIILHYHLISFPRENCAALLRLGNNKRGRFYCIVLHFPLSCAKLVCFCYMFIF